MKLSKMLGERRTIVVMFLGESVRVDYKPQAITPLFLDQLTECQTARDVLVKQCVELVGEWDIVDDQGQPLAPTLEFCRTLSTDFLAAVVDGIRDDRRAGLGESEEKKASGAG